MMSTTKYLALFVLMAVQQGCFAQSPYFGRDQPPISSQHTSAVERFVRSFADGLHRSPALEDAVRPIMVPVHNFAQLLFSAIQIQYYKGSYTPQDLGFSATNPYPPKANLMNRKRLVSIFAVATGKQLEAEGILNDFNASSLGYEFASTMEASAQRTVRQDVPESKYQALVDGYIIYINGKGLYQREKLEDMANYLGHALQRAIKQY